MTGFVGLNIILDGDGCWPDLRARAQMGNEAPLTQELEVAELAGGMHSGKPSVMIRFNLPNGDVALGETSLALFLSAADAFKARFGDPR